MMKNRVDVRAAMPAARDVDLECFGLVGVGGPPAGTGCPFSDRPGYRRGDCMCWMAFSPPSFHAI